MTEDKHTETKPSPSSEVVTKEGYKKTKLGWIPEDWEIIKLSKVIELESGQHLSPTEYNGRDKGVPYFTGPTDFCSDLDSVSKWTQEGKKFAESGDILITVKGSGVGTLYISSLKRVAIGRQLMAIRPKEAVQGFIFNFLLQRKKWLEVLASGNMIPGLSRNDILNLKISLPSLSEQKKIAETLSTWDRAISTLEQLIEAKKRYKKGLMQQLLSGKKRFQEFVKSKDIFETKFGNYPEDWAYPKIKNFAKQLRDRKKPEKDGYTVLSCTKYDGLVDSLEYFDRQVFSDDLSNYKVVAKGTFAYATNHIEEGSIGYNDWCENGLISPMYKVFETDQDKVNDQYLYRVFKTEKYRHIFEINTNGTVNRRGSLNWKSFENIRVPLPPLEEQNKIAEVIQTAEQEIALLEQELKAIKKQKKGLMQKLLTGKVRVTKQKTLYG